MLVDESKNFAGQFLCLPPIFEVRNSDLMSIFRSSSVGEILPKIEKSVFEKNFYASRFAETDLRFGIRTPEMRGGHNQ